MGIKKLVSIVALSLCVFYAQCQITITHFEAHIDVDANAEEILVHEIILFSGDNNNLQATLQSMDFDNASINNLKVKVNGSTTAISLTKNNNGLFEAKIPVKNFYSVDITYSTRATSLKVIAPLIFVSALTRSADEKLFTATITLPARYQLTESFPTIETTEVQEGSLRTYTVELPVIPSMIKFKMAEDFVVGITEILDMTVLLTLGLLGVIGWKKRKMLS